MGGQGWGWGVPQPPTSHHRVGPLSLTHKTNVFRCTWLPWMHSKMRGSGSPPPLSGSACLTACPPHFPQPGCYMMGWGLTSSLAFQPSRPDTPWLSGEPSHPQPPPLVACSHPCPHRLQPEGVQGLLSQIKAPGLAAQLRLHLAQSDTACSFPVTSPSPSLPQPLWAV